ncbi:MAG: methyltransferase type 11 [Desulfobacterales bacterium C00003106]|nr:MAG: methyltransferase type 11 [Desulfobacterales bacterium C00003106]
MSIQNRWHERYKTADIPWDTGRPDFNLIDMVTKRPIPGCRTLEVGCGTGDNAIWLARHSFRVTGSDLSEIAIQKAGDKASDAGVECRFVVADFLRDKISGAPFGLLFDRGCFHSFRSDEQRNRFVDNAAFHLEEDGLWLSIIGSADDAPRDHGPPRHTAGEIVNAVEPHFEILSLHSSHFESNRTTPPGAWVCLMRKRAKKRGASLETGTK